MNKFHRLAAGLLLPLACLSCGGDSTANGSGNATEASAVPDLETAARTAAKGVATVTEAVTGTAPGMIFVLPENHASYRGQLQQAVVMLRLNRDVKLGGIVLEGMTRPIPSPPKVNEETALNLLSEGEIGSAEFMAVSQGVPLVTGETAASYGPEENDNFCGAFALVATLEAASAAPDDAARAEVKQQLDAFGAAEAQSAQAHDAVLADQSLSCDAKRGADRQYLAERARYLKPIIERSPTFAASFARQCPYSIEDVDTSAGPSIEEELNTADQLLEFTGNLPPELAQSPARDIEQHRNFLRARQEASGVLVDQALAASANGDGIAMIIGAAHTERVASLLRNAGASFAVIQVEAIKDNPEEGMSPREWERKKRAIPVKNNALSQSLVADSSAYAADACDSEAKRNPPTIDQPWFVRKAELYDLIRSFASPALGGSGEPPQPPASGWRNGSGAIDPSRSEYERDDKGRPIAVVFPLTIAATGNSAEREIWVRVEPASPLVESGEDGRPPRTAEERILERLGEGPRATGGGKGRPRPGVFVGFKERAQFFKSRAEVDTVRANSTM